VKSEENQFTFEGIVQSQLAEDLGPLLQWNLLSHVWGEENWLCHRSIVSPAMCYQIACVGAMSAPYFDNNCIIFYHGY
jgi:hypothetical protein